MKTGAGISGGLHLTLLAVAFFGLDWFSNRDEDPLTVTEVEFVDATEFEAQLSTAPYVSTDDPEELTKPGEGDPAPDTPASAEEATESAAAPELTDVPEPEDKPEPPEIAFATPTDVPTEAPKPTIAEIPSPAPLEEQSVEPESPPSTEPVAPLTTLDPPRPEAKPTPPPEPEPEPKEEEEPKVATAPSEEAEVVKTPDPVPEEKSDPKSTEEIQEKAPEGPAPELARLPIAKPADKARAAEAARQAEADRLAEEKREEHEKAAAIAAAKREKEERTAAKTETREKPAAKPRNDGGSTPVRARKLNTGERRGLSIGVSKYLNYTGSKSPAFYVIVNVKLTEGGEIRGTPKMVRAKGSSDSAHKALYRAGIRALKRAAAAGVFRKLPKDKYPRWKSLNFRLYPDKKVNLS